jgi:hypothetical protein
MAAPAKVNFKIYQGSTFSEVLRWESSRKIYKNITGITKAAPVVITSTGHGIPEGWRVKITDVGGMKELNNSDTYRVATVLTANTIEINDINSSSYAQYTTGGVLEYNEPVNMSGYTARMQLRTKVDDPVVLLELTTENNGIILNTTTNSIIIQITATDTAAITWKTAVYNLELVSSGGQVTSLCTGSISMNKEVTR